MRKRNLLAIIFAFVLLTSSASVYAIQTQKEKIVDNKETEPIYQDGNFIAEIGLEKMKRPFII